MQGIKQFGHDTGNHPRESRRDQVAIATKKKVALSIGGYDKTGIDMSKTPKTVFFSQFPANGLLFKHEFHEIDTFETFQGANYIHETCCPTSGRGEILHRLG